MPGCSGGDRNTGIQQNLTIWVQQYSKAVATGVEEWYKHNGRDFFWRHTVDPYVIAISEILLKRTQAERVNRFIGSFLARFPDPKYLAAAQLEDIENLVSPLGLAKQRARNLKDFAVYIQDQLHGRMPRSREELEQVPGLGAYSAAAVACFSFGVRCAVIDTNTIRLFKRLARITPTKNDERRCPYIRAIGEAIIENANDVKKVNWGLLDLGALVCKPHTPLCTKCPLNSMCWSAAGYC